MSSKPSPGSRWRVAPGAKPDLATVDTKTKGGAPGDKDATKAATAALRDRLAALQAALYAEDKRSLLVVLQAMDAGGKDGTIRSVFGGVNPQGVRVASFKAPTDEELSHDFLWRVHAQAPPRGSIAVFNRSHYEDVLIARVHGLVPERTWRRRYEHIRSFEELLTDNGTTVVKLMLHISRDEQRERLQARVDDPTKRWKFNAADLAEREHWDAYQEAFAEAIERTSTKHAPWHVIPADRNWYRDWAVLGILVEVLERLDPQYPAAPAGLAGTTIPQ
jgi:PPK2 family polyphosphate:nucleotide phosphotransferase